MALLRMRGITKIFPGVVALDGVDFDLNEGEVHVLLGENGAGKSTLMKILAGIYSADQGEILIHGKPVVFQNAKDAAEHGISIIHQEFNLIPHLSVAENIFIGREPIKGWPARIDFEQMNAATAEILRSFNLDLKPTDIVGELSVAMRQMVEIARAISTKSKIIIMDEPTAAITEQEIAELFSHIEQLKEQGVGIIYISHRLSEVLEIGDRVSVLRDGKYVGTRNAKETDTDELIRMMVGREITTFYPKESVEIGEEILVASDVSRPGYLKDISFSVRRGEVLGVAGLMGSGRTELMRAIFGADRGVSGQLFINGREIDLANHSPEKSVKSGLAFLTEDRKGSGLLLNLAVHVNLTLAGLGRLTRFGVIDKHAETDASLDLVKLLDIKTPSIGTSVNSLSGGNQQKVILARWLFNNADIIILDEPTRGIDVGAKVEIYSIINELVSEGKAVIMVSSDLPEVLSLSDRIMVLCQGTLAGIVERDEASQERIMELATGSATLS